MLPTDKQRAYVKRIKDYFGNDELTRFMKKHHMPIDINKLDRKQTQKIITSFGVKISKPPIKGVKHYDQSIVFKKAWCCCNVLWKD